MTYFFHRIDARFGENDFQNWSNYLAVVNLKSFALKCNKLGEENWSVSQEKYWQQIFAKKIPIH